MIFMGDFFQLPPPEGGFIADVPHSLKSATGVDKSPDPLVEAGRDLFWRGAVQGVTELTETRRCSDEWWNEVVEQLRQGRLSEENHKYLHGIPVEGCTLSEAAVVIVANNDARYQINKDKARAYSKESGAPLRWSVAKDVAEAKALQAEDCSKEAKRKWLQYHDRHTGDLCGLLPLAIGMPVALTDHVDRSDKFLLRGRCGHVHSWVWPENEQQPEVVYVKFPDVTWQLPGTPEPGIYPLRPVTEAWFLDRGRENPVLKVKRKQLQLTPAFAITAHSSQGKTLDATLLDLNVDKNVHQTLGTVAASRVRSREDVLILRPFPLWLFQRGAPEGPDLLLKTLRKEPVDWKAWRESKNPFAACGSCGHVKDFANFSYAEWGKVRANRAAKCLHCEKGGKTTGKRKISRDAEIFTKHACDICGCSKMAAAFPVAQLRQEGPNVKKVCTQCARNQRTLTCAMCGKTKPSDAFDATMCTLPPGCAACADCQQELHPKAKRLRG
ncbi:pfh1, partial [Symbiodinium necroappetens]